jgi:hypothetical protein
MKENFVRANLKMLYDDFEIENISFLNETDWIANGKWKYDDIPAAVQYSSSDFLGLQERFVDIPIFCFRRNNNYEIGIYLTVDNQSIPLHYFVQKRVHSKANFCLDCYNDYETLDIVENKAKKHIKLISDWFIHHHDYRLQIITNQLIFRLDMNLQAYLSAI